MPGEIHCFESLHCLLRESPVATGGAERTERERFAERARLRPLRCLCFDALAVAERDEGVKERRQRLDEADGWEQNGNIRPIPPRPGRSRPVLPNPG